MKKLATSYTFDAIARTVTCSDFSRLDAILLITNVTTNTIIYNFAGAGKGGTLSGTTLTLDFNTASMSNADSLQIFVDNLDNPVSEESVVLLRRMVKLLESSAVVDSSNRQRVSVDNILLNSGSPTLGVPGVNQITALAPNSVSSVSYTPVWVGPVDQRYILMDQARNTYANAMRSQLTF